MSRKRKKFDDTVDTFIVDESEQVSIIKEEETVLPEIVPAVELIKEPAKLVKPQNMKKSVRAIPINSDQKAKKGIQPYISKKSISKQGIINGSMQFAKNFTLDSLRKKI